MSTYVLYDNSIRKVVAASDSRLTIHKEYWKQVDEFGADRKELVVIDRETPQTIKIHL